MRFAAVSGGPDAPIYRPMSEIAPDLPPPPKGVGVIETQLQTMPLSPGVYGMLEAKGEAV